MTSLTTKSFKLRAPIVVEIIVHDVEVDTETGEITDFGRENAGYLEDAKLRMIQRAINELTDCKYISVGDYELIDKIQDEDLLPL